MLFRKTDANEITSKEFLKQASKCKVDELHDLLNQIQIKIESSTEKDFDLLMAKTMITSRIASVGNR
jgi:hypothetical protein